VKIWKGIHKWEKFNLGQECETLKKQIRHTKTWGIGGRGNTGLEQREREIAAGVRE
jgi:hypothetical protein